MYNRKYILFALLFITTTQIFAGGVVYLVLGSDTAIWNGMNTGTYNNFYNIDLYTNPTENAFTVMDPAFRAGLKDSYGNPMKLTWWMMAGNIFRYATNTNVPVPNIMTLYLMKKYHGENVIINGDELTLHYHTFYWSDYDNDGIYYWNQSKTFLESLDDFKFTLAQFLLEEEVFPVSFRSGWHYMDNEWQHYLDQRVLPYSFHNDYPKKRTFDEEPIDNIFDWSEAPSSWIPYNPSYLNYQIPGNGNGWNVRSASLGATIYENYMDSVFAAASNGTDQVACFWAHLPEVDFIDKLEAVNSLAHAAESKYPGVTFKYCTAIEAMQLWREGNDNQSPELTFTESPIGDEVYFNISSDEIIFQTQPFVAIKDIYENYIVAECRKIGENNWITNSSFTKSDLVKVGATVCDTMGNQTMEFIEYLPADIHIDNLDIQYSEALGNWSTNSTNSWGVDSRVVQLGETDSVVAQWKHTIGESTHYNIFVQVPEIANPVENFEYVIYTNSIPTDTIKFHNSMEPYRWVYLTTLICDEADEIIVEYRASGKGQATKYAVADVLKISAFVKNKEIHFDKTVINLDEIAISDIVIYPLTISNYGINTLKIFGLNSLGNSLISKFSFPIEIPKMSSVEIDLEFTRNELGDFTDSLIILSDDPSKGKYIIPVFGYVQNYFVTIDNEDLLNYSEFGEWSTSVATSNGLSSRYAWLNSNPKASAEFKTKLQKSGKYEIYEIIPSTVNSSDNALYQISINNIIIDSLYFNQNDESGNWKLLGSYYLPGNIDIIVKVIDTGLSSVSGVLRTDAIKFQLVEELTNIADKVDNQKMNYQLSQNYPNPFNPSTTISFQIPKASHVKIDVFNLLGERVNTLVDENLNAGRYSTIWKGNSDDGTLAASGIYFYRIQSAEFTDTKKMIYLR